ncbi:MAG: alpha/beta hydrolase domain-containing protein, partial [Planctomycetales bacterium]
EQDPFTGKTDGILRKARQAKSVPKIMHIQTSADYWGRGGSLVHVDPTGTRDAVLPPEVRVYAIGGAEHFPGDDFTLIRAGGQFPRNPTDYRPIARALLVALDAWVRDEVPPPPSVYPRIADGALVDWQASNSGWRALPGVRYPEVIHSPESLDFGPDFASKGILSKHPPARRGTHRVLVPAYFKDGNERGMLRLPSVAVPVATYLGWNLRSRGVGAENELLDLRGSHIPFAQTPERREAFGDPRPALLERYRDFEDYLSRYRAALRELVAERCMLPEDAGLLLRRAERRRALFDR